MATKQNETNNSATFTGSKTVLVSTDSIKFKEGDWWARRTTLEKSLLVFSVIAVATAIGLLVAFLLNKPEIESESQPETHAQVDSEGICSTVDCVRVAARISDAINYNIKPCDDFYDFACGTWKRRHVIPEDKSSYNSFSVVREDVDVILKNALEKEDTSSDLDAVQKAKILYRSCLDEDKLEELGVQPVLDFLPMIGGWPVLTSNWSDSTYSLENLLIKLAKYNNYPIIELSVSTDLKQVDRNILYLDQPSFGMPGQKYYFKGRNDTMVKAYETLAVKVAVLLGADQTTAENDMKDMVDFEMILANISVRSEDRRDSEKLYNKMTFSQLAQNYSQFNWLDYVQGIMSSPKIQINITQDEEIINYSPPYFNQLFQVLNQTPGRTVTNYVAWLITSYRIQYITKAFRNLILDYKKVLYGTSTEKARWKTCVSYVDGSVGKAVGRLFIKEAFDQEAKLDMLILIKNLKMSFEEQLWNNDWMDSVTKTVAKEKSDVIGHKIGFDDKIMNNTYLNEQYENYTYVEGEYFNNVVMKIEEGAAYSFRELRKPVDKSKWYMTPSAVNAYYSTNNNEIVFPAGILQPPFYHKHFPKSVNYGGIGMVIGHEITHGFDDQGRQYDKDGSLRQWWSNEAIKQFKAKAECVINQYGNFTVEEADIQINGINTQGENIADNGGITQSFKAYRNWVKERGTEEQKLPGLDFTPNQLFFVNFAQVWCGNMRKESAINRILTGVHSPSKFRVIGTLQNSPDFAATFDCPASSYMNPVKKCQVW